MAEKTATKLLGALLVVVFTSAANAQGLSIRCPTTGLFTGPPKIFDLPNPSAGWDFFFDEGTLQKVELSSAPKPDGFWLITCHIQAQGASFSITVNISGRKACHIAPNGGLMMSLQDGGQSCEVGKSNANDSDDRCAISCR